MTQPSPLVEFAVRSSALTRTAKGPQRLSGSASVDEVKISRDAVHDQIAFVFQSFGRYSTSSADNIACGDWRVGVSLDSNTPSSLHGT
jgi:hypothetical protein